MSWDVDTAAEAAGTPANSSDNVDFSLASIFREIGTTLVDVTKQGISTVGATVKTSLANEIMKSPEGQAQISAYKMQTVIQYLPWLILAGIALLVGGRYLKA